MYFSLFHSKEPHMCNLILCVASGMMECFCYLLCFHIFAAFITGTIVYTMVGIATHYYSWGGILLRSSAVLFAFLGGVFGSAMAFYFKEKIGVAKCFTRMLLWQTFIYLLLLLSVGVMFFMGIGGEAIATLTAMTLSFLMGIHHHHVKISYRRSVYRTHLMTFNTWTLFNDMVHYWRLRLEGKKGVTMKKLEKKIMFLMLVLGLFFLGVLLEAILIQFISWYALVIPWILFVMATLLSGERWYGKTY